MSDKHSCSQWCWQPDNPDRHLCGDQHQAGMVCILPVGHETTAVSDDVTREDVTPAPFASRDLVLAASKGTLHDFYVALDAYAQSAAARQVRAAEEAQRVAERERDEATNEMVAERERYERVLAEVRALADVWASRGCDSSDETHPHETPPRGHLCPECASHDLDVLLDGCDWHDHEDLRTALDAGRDQGGERA